jgi:hypothetical protein
MGDGSIMPQRRYVLAASTVGLLFSIGAASALGEACAPSAAPSDASVDGPVCNPDSSDPAGCGCDPSTSKVADCYTGPPGTNGKGICQTGKRSCTPQGTWTACVGEVVPQPEICNLTDDDCDGLVDDVPEISDAAVIAKCNSPACEPSFADAAITCWGPDPGICGAGTKTCAGGPKGGTPTGCNEFIHTPATEICNGIDDDCNGIVDDGLDNEGPCDVPAGTKWPADASPFEGGQPTQILGACLKGQMACVNSNCDAHGCRDAGDQCFPTQPTTESCNGLDDDCNGAIDEHSCAQFQGTGSTFCCSSGTYHTCAPSYYTQYGYICYDAGP